MEIVYPSLQFKEPLQPFNLDDVRFIIVHHIEASKATIADIHQWHLENGWSGCGYNEYIRKDGTVYIGRGDNIGAHCKGHNKDAYGIALEGNFNKESITKEQKKSLVERLKVHVPRFKNCNGIFGHKAFMSTECPGKNLDLIKISEEVYRVEKIKEHWGLAYWETLNKSGVEVLEKRFDDNIKRAEVFKLLAEVLKRSGGA